MNISLPHKGVVIFLGLGDILFLTVYIYMYLVSAMTDKGSDEVVLLSEQEISS
jgi:hypothetical protein